MYFNIPTKLYFTPEVLANYGSMIVNFGKKALLVTGKTSAEKSGVLADLLPILQRDKISYTIFSEIMENPETSVIDKGTRILNDIKCDFLIAIGGGSPIDATKAIAIQYANNLHISEIYHIEKHKKALPIIAIPTTSGTGSEITQYSVLTSSENGTKAGFGSELIFPKIAFLDAKYTFSLSKTITRDTAIDALSHLLEGLYSNKYNEYLMPIIYHGVKLIFDNLVPCMAEPANIKHREALMLASNYGGVVIAHTSTTLQHSIGYPLTTTFGVSHGLANGLVMKQIMELYEPYLNDRLTLLFNHLKITKNQFFDWLDTLQMKFVGRIDNEFLSQKVSEVMKSRNMALNPVQINEEEIKKIYISIND